MDVGYRASTLPTLYENLDKGGKEGGDDNEGRLLASKPRCREKRRVNTARRDKDAMLFLTYAEAYPEAYLTVRSRYHPVSPNSHPAQRLNGNYYEVCPMYTMH